jgi:NAD(P)-dependent dehydrogenase (short-subunit alcohol dehydrogenase family)
VGTLEGRVAIITGGGRGIGRSIAHLFAREGASLVINDLGVKPDGTGNDAGPAHDVVDEILALGGSAVANGDDIADTATGEALVATAISAYGKLDVVANVAGIVRDRMIFNMSPEDWDAVIRVHLRGDFSTIRPAAAYWREQRNPAGHYRIINFTSVSGLEGSPGQANYATAKMGVIGLTYSLAQGLARYGVTANAIAPGAATRLTASVPAGKELGFGQADEQKFSPDNVAPITAYLASEHSDWLSGRTISAVGYDVELYANPEIIATASSDGPWSLNDLAAKVEAQFKPLADGLPFSSFAEQIPRT